MKGCEQGRTGAGSSSHILTATWMIVTAGYHSYKIDP